jgi:hypothetical protein
VSVVTKPPPNFTAYAEEVPIVCVPVTLTTNALDEGPRVPA